MKRYGMSVRRFIDDEEGLTVVEYGLAGALVVATGALAFKNLGLSIVGLLQQLASELG